MQQLLLLVLALTLQAQPGRFGLPNCAGTLAQRQDFTVCFDTINRCALWTAHEINCSAGLPARRGWRMDHEPNSLPSSAFTNSGYHRGHLVPVADAPGSADIFLTSNAVPQDPKLNVGGWRALEHRIRAHAASPDSTIVITGATYGGCGNEQIEAPCHLFKIALFSTNGAHTIIAALAPNAPATVVSVPLDDVERHSRLTFFPARRWVDIIRK